MIRDNIVEGIVARADVPRSDGVILPAEEVRKFADGQTLFWDESRKVLVYRGPDPGCAAGRGV